MGRQKILNSMTTFLMQLRKGATKMTMIRKIILATIALMVLSSVGYGADWKYFDKDADDNLWFYDTQSISREQDTVRVWVKFVLSDKTKKEYIKNFPKTPGMENTSHTKDRWEINCSKNIKRVLSSVWCDTEGNIIMDKDYPDYPFSEVIPESIGAGLVEIICQPGEGG